MTQFPSREKRSHVDVFPGLAFYFVGTDSLARKATFGMWDEHTYVAGALWTVIHKQTFTSRAPRFLLLGNGGLVWHDGTFGFIRRVADPVWEERYANGCCRELDARGR